MKIAVASEGEMVAGHFGHCSNFNIYDVEDEEIVKSEKIDNPGHKPGFLPNFLNEKGVSVIISGGMGQGAIDIFDQNNIEVITGANSRAEDAVKSYIKGELKSSGVVCNKHEHRNECGGH